MKRERVQFLVTVSLGYETPAAKREMLKTARECLMSSSEGGTAGWAKPVKIKRVDRRALPRKLLTSDGEPCPSFACPVKSNE